MRITDIDAQFSLSNSRLKFYIRVFVFLFCSFWWGRLHSQTTGNNRNFFVEPEFMLGSIVANYNGFPESSGKTSYFLNLGRRHLFSDKHYASYFAFPTTGLSVSITDLGNKEILGKEISAIPYIKINLSRKRLSSWYLKFGLGASYFTRYFDEIDNPENKVIGSPYTWTFQSFIYRTLILKPRFQLQLGAGYWHSSNGHTTLPNFGMNSAQISVAAQFFTKPVNLNFYENTMVPIEKKKQWFIRQRFGYGVHELGGAGGPVGGSKKGVYTFGLGGGLILKRHLKINTGFAYRYYEHYFDEIVDRDLSQFKDQPRWNASNFFFFLETEFLFGHVGMEIGGGLNLYKPYFEQYYKDFASGSTNAKYWLKKMITSRMGLNLYLLNNNLQPRNNVFIGAHINANFGQADFTEISLGFQRMINR